MSPISNLTRRSRQRLAYLLIALLGAIIVGTVGYHFIEGWSVGDSLYMALMTMTTVGYGPPHALSTAGRDFTIFYMILGVGVTGFALSSAVQALVQSEIVDVFGKRRRQREIGRMRDHFIICGAGRVGSRIVRELQRAGVPFLVIESDAQKARQLELPAAQVLVRDATLDETLIEAGIERARGLAACLPADAENLYVVLTARDLNRELQIVTRAVEESAEPKLIKAGASRVISPTLIGSHRMATALLRPAVADFMDSVAADNLDLAFEQVEVGGSSELAGHRLRETRIRSELDIVIAAIRRADGQMTFNPSGETKIEPGDLLIAIGRADALVSLHQLAEGNVK